MEEQLGDMKKIKEATREVIRKGGKIAHEKFYTETGLKRMLKKIRAEK